MHWLRDAWLVVGISLGLLFAAEGAYRAQLWGKRIIVGNTPQPWKVADHPYYGQAWFPEFVAARDRQSYTLDPYLGSWGRPMRSRYLNIDSTGRRLTPHRDQPAASQRVLLFGGSSMWGYTARDSFTIPSQLGTALSARAIRDVEIVSDAQPGFNATQEANALEIEFARGARPAAVVFMNGYNDAASALVSQRIGRPFSEERAQQLMNLGRRGFLGELAGLVRHSAAIQRLLQATQPSAKTATFVPADSICPQVAAYYASIERGVIAMAAEHGVRVLIFQQPHHTSSRKRLTRYEAGLPNDRRLAACADSMVALMSRRAPTMYYDLRALFDRDTVTMFVDYHSHLTESANGRVAEAIAARLEPLLRSKTQPNSAF